MTKESDIFGTGQRGMRRRPSQERSERTVARVMEVTLALILKEGYNALSTNRIAQEAKVNIASLYQYFPNKYAIVLAMYEKAASEFATLSHNSMMGELTKPLESSLPRIIERMMKFLEARQPVLLQLLNEVPELRQTAAQASVENMTAQVTYLYIKQHFPKLDDSTIRFKMFFCQHTSMALAYHYLLDRPANMSRKRFVAETSRILLDILKSKSQPGASSSPKASLKAG